MTWEIINADVMAGLRQLNSSSVHCVVSSPPYYGLRDYKTGTWEGGDPSCDHKKSNGQRIAQSAASVKGGGHAAAETGPAPMTAQCSKCGATRVDQQIGLEATPWEFIDRLVEVFREVRRVLRPDGCLFLNMGDSYANDDKWGGHTGGKHVKALHTSPIGRNKKYTGFKPKCLMMMPARLAIALCDDGWYLRSEVIWHKPNPMCEPVQDRPTRAHEQVFLLTKSPRYFYDALAIATPVSAKTLTVSTTPQKGNGTESAGEKVNKWMEDNGGRYHPATANARTVWTIAAEPFPDAHFATFPTELVRRCLLAGTSGRGCCSECGKCWVRIVEEVDTGMTQKMADGWATHEGGHGSIHVNGREKGSGGVPVMASQTIGWKPQCKCAADVVPCRVLDPFAGSGTTLVVALRHGRDAVGIELSEAYAAMARKRIVEDMPLFNATDNRQETQAEAGLFDELEATA